MSTTSHDPFYSSPFGPFYRRHTPYMMQPEYRIYEINKRLQVRSEMLLLQPAGTSGCRVSSSRCTGETRDSWETQSHIQEDPREIEGYAPGRQPHHSGGGSEEEDATAATRYQLVTYDSGGRVSGGPDAETDNSEEKEEEVFGEPAEDNPEASQSSQPGPSHLVPSQTQLYESESLDEDDSQLALFKDSQSRRQTSRHEQRKAMRHLGRRQREATP